MPRRALTVSSGIARGARQGCRALTMGQEPHLATPDDNGSAQEASGVRAAFSLDTFFSTAGMQELEQRRSSCRGRTKESITPSGAGTRLKIPSLATQ